MINLAKISGTKVFPNQNSKILETVNSILNELNVSYMKACFIREWLYDILIVLDEKYDKELSKFSKLRKQIFDVYTDTMIQCTEDLWGYSKIIGFTFTKYKTPIYNYDCNYKIFSDKERYVSRQLSCRSYFKSNDKNILAVPFAFLFAPEKLRYDINAQIVDFFLAEKTNSDVDIIICCNPGTYNYIDSLHEEEKNELEKYIIESIYKFNDLNGIDQVKEKLLAEFSYYTKIEITELLEWRQK